MPKYQLFVDRRAVKWLSKLPPKDQVKIWNAIESLTVNPRQENVKLLMGSPGLLRLRVGDYRIIYKLKETELYVLVLKIGHRRDVYRNIENIF